MNYSRLPHQRSEGYGQVGLALVELVISAAIIAVLTMAVSLAVFNTHRRSSEARVTLGQLEARNVALRHLVGNLRWATGINAGDGRQIVCQVPGDDLEGSSETIGYQWDPNSQQLRCFRPGFSPQLIARNVSIFQAATSPVEDDPSKLDAVTIKLQVGSDPAGLTERTIVLVNKPDLSIAP